MRHKLDSTRLIRDEAYGTGRPYEHPSKGLAALELFGATAIGGTLGSITLGFAAQAIFSNMNDETTLHPAFWLTALFCTFLPTFWWVIMPRFHIYHGMERAQRNAYDKYLQMNDLAKKELPPEKEIRKALLESTDSEASDLYQSFVTLKNRADAAAEAEKSLTPEQRSARMESLIDTARNSGESLSFYTEKLRELS